MKKTIRAAVISSLMFLAAAPAAVVATSQAVAAKPDIDTYAFDTVHTQIFFSVSHLGFSFSTGSFTTFDGGFTFDAEKPEHSSVKVSIDAASLSLHDAKWEEHVKSADFLNAAEHPKITFHSTQVEKTGENTGRITGNLTLLGVTKPVTLDVIFNKAAVHPYTKQYVAGFSATGALNRSDFGMDYGLPGIGDEVNITLEVEGIRTEAPAQKP
ncbi:MAG: YceI family protein [Bdellovibrionales bacterium]|nr:YceI family protein [Bdellovibrionales bacterium]